MRQCLRCFWLLPSFEISVMFGAWPSSVTILLSFTTDSSIVGVVQDSLDLFNFMQCYPWIVPRHISAGKHEAQIQSFCRSLFTKIQDSVDLLNSSSVACTSCPFCNGIRSGLDRLCRSRQYSLGRNHKVLYKPLCCLLRFSLSDF